MRTDDKLLCFVIKYMFCTFVYKRKHITEVSAFWTVCDAMCG